MNAENPAPVTTEPDGRPRSEQPVWRQEYPVDAPESEYVSRREFTRLMLVTSLAFVAGQAYIVLSGLLRRTAPLPAAEVAAVAALPTGSVKLFHYPTANDPCILVRLSETSFVAYSQKCTHLSCPVIPRPETGRIECPCHDGLYNLRTGDVISGPPERSLPRITLEVRDGRVYATGVEGGAL